MDETSPIRPESASKPLPNLIAYGFGVLAFVVASTLGVSSVMSCFLALAVTGFGIILHDVLVLRVHRRATAGLGQMREHNFVRAAIKFIGLGATLWIVMLASNELIPLIGRSASRILGLYPIVFPLILLLAPAYILWVDRRMDQPEDGLYQMGCLVLLRWRGRDWGDGADLSGSRCP